jgi:peptidyl-tRNA hydrolase, PTH1 family
MKAIVGLGNPGKQYSQTRHNIGFLVIKKLAQEARIGVKKEVTIFSTAGKGSIDGCDVLLAMPYTYMNLSGVAVKALVRKYHIEPQDLLVVCDDLDLNFGRLKIKGMGSAGGHRGLQSIIGSLYTQEFNRLRVGIGRNADNVDAAEYVLSDFNSNEEEGIKTIIEKSVACCYCWLQEGLAASMNRFNTSASVSGPTRERKESKNE